MPHLDMKTAKFDLSLTMKEEGDRIEAEFRYSTELFKHSTIERYTPFPFPLVLSSALMYYKNGCRIFGAGKRDYYCSVYFHHASSLFI